MPAPGTRRSCATTNATATIAMRNGVIRVRVYHETAVIAVSALQQFPVRGRGWLAFTRPRLFTWPSRRRAVAIGSGRRQHRQRRTRRALDGAHPVRSPLVGLLEPMRLVVAASVDLLEPGWLDPHPLALEKPEDA